jgi:hypothetical protein
LYDHEQPAAGADVSAVVALTSGTGVGTPVIRGVDGCHDLVTVRSQLGVLVEYVPPALIIQYDGASVQVGRFSQDAQRSARRCGRFSDRYAYRRVAH